MNPNIFVLSASKTTIALMHKLHKLIFGILMYNKKL